jgi:hypothetical protein
MAAIEDRQSEAADRLERLYEEHGEHVRAICTGLLRDRQEAEDARHSRSFSRRWVAAQRHGSARRGRVAGDDLPA